MELLPHPSNTPEALRIEANVERDGESLIFTFRLIGNTDLVRVPPVAPPIRTDSLWQTTCFEAFVAQDGERYLELNFSPTGAWAAYAFDAYRQGMRPLDLAQPQIQRAGDTLSATVALSAPAGVPLSLSAVVEATDGGKSYWALAHSPGAPDFHDRHCFVARLP